MFAKRSTHEVRVMKITRARAIEGFVGGIMAAAVGEHLTIAAARAEDQGREAQSPLAFSDDLEEPRFAPNELVLSITFDGTLMPGQVQPILNSILPFVSSVVPSKALTWSDLPVSPVHSPLTSRLTITPASDVRGAWAKIYSQTETINLRIKKNLQQWKLASNFQLSSVMPNWYWSSAQLAWAGGPGSKPSAINVPPIPSPPGVASSALAWTPSNGLPPGLPVPVVVIFDTWPPSPSRNPPPPGPYADFQTFMNTPGMFTLTSFVPNGTTMRPWPISTHCTADHGLFVAGLVHSIASYARIHVLRVLDRFGFGKTDTLLAGLQYCQNLYGDGKHLVVVNLSLYMMIPPDDQNGGLYSYWSSYNTWWPSARKTQRSTVPAKATLDVRALHWEVQTRITSLRQSGAVVVAAAGNDAQFVDYGHPQPRLPADYDNVIGVVATDPAGAIATYSNQADTNQYDEPLPDDTGPSTCVATYGGQANAQSMPDPGVISLYSQSPSGYAMWSGTSFATPIISAVAANVLVNQKLQPSYLTDADTPPQKVMAAIVSAPSPLSPPPPPLGRAYVQVK
jgi:hypothetical protein